VCLAGISGWTGKCVAEAILKAPDLSLTGAVARKAAGQDIGKFLGVETIGANISSSVEDGLKNGANVYVDYTSAEVVKINVMKALKNGIACVVGSSGLTADDYKEIEELARHKNVGVIACGNFSITAALAKHFALLAAEHLSHWEIIDYASAGKLDAPSGTTRELAEQLSVVRANTLGRPLDQIHGPRESRGAQISGTPVHSIRLPSYVIAFETIFGLPNERLTIRHDAGSGPEPYVDGTLIAVRKVIETKGLVRGLDALLFNKAPERSSFKKALH
jgi:4-hydroxy-tetrahydrodipicolinate reductase